MSITWSVSTETEPDSMHAQGSSSSPSLDTLGRLRGVRPGDAHASDPKPMSLQVWWWQGT